MTVKLRRSQFDKLSDLALGLGQLFFGSLVVPFVIPSLDRPPIVVLIFGLIVTLILWYIGIKIVK